MTMSWPVALQPFVPNLDPAIIKRAVHAKDAACTSLPAVDYLDYLWTDPPPPTLDQRPRRSACARRSTPVKDVAWEPEPIELRGESRSRNQELARGKFYTPCATC